MLLSLKPLAILSLVCFVLILLLYTPIEERPFHPHIIAPHTFRPLHHHHAISSSQQPSPLACRGRRVFVHNLPPLFNARLLRQCRNAIAPWLNFCAHLAHRGLGEPLPPDQLLALSTRQNTSRSSSAYYHDSFLQVLDQLPQGNSRGRPSDRRSSGGEDGPCRSAQSLSQGPAQCADWYRTDPYMLEVIFHNRFLQYPCLTQDPHMADAFFLPYYTGLDALNYLYGKQKFAPKATHGSQLVSWLKQDPIAKEAWKKHGGQDHFLILSRTPWDFENLEQSDWGTGFLGIPEVGNMTLLLVEKQTWVPNQHAVPYPTSFHPSSASSLYEWMKRVRTEERATLFTFAGSIRPTLMKDGIRDMLMDQCSSSTDCKLLDCKELKCSHNPEPIMRAFLSSQFCLQPRGDTPTRRSLFDAIIAGCIPVLFHKDTAYTQYEWHLPKEASQWSVYIDEAEIRKGELVEGRLREYAEETILQMRDRLMQMIPKIVYAKESMLKRGEADAFDITVRETLKLISYKKRKITNLVM